MANDYVLIVHGTFDGPKAGETKWYQPDDTNPSNFCSRLNDALQKSGADRWVWRKQRTREVRFSWSGANNHEERIAAGRRLFEKLREIERADGAARIHFVAHSHGGNVVLVAIQAYVEALKEAGNKVYAALEKAEFEPTKAAASVAQALQAHVGSETAMECWRVSSVQTLLDDRLRYKTHQRPRDGSWTKDYPSHKINEYNLGPSDGVDGVYEYRKFLQAWLADTDVNRIGRLVFLGTPFVVKRWHHTGRWTLKNILGVCIDIAVALALGLFVSLFLCALLFLPYLGWVSAKYMLYSQLSLEDLQVVAGLPFVVIVVGIMLAFWGFYESGSGRKDVNLYSASDTFSNFEVIDLYDALIVHAGHADEAFLGLSAEVLVYGLLNQRIASMFASPSQDVGTISGQESRARYIFGGWLSRMRDRLTSPIRRLLAPHLGRRFTATMTNVLQSAALGVSPQELREASLIVTNTIDHPAIFRETPWDVGRLLASTSLVPPLPKSADLRRYEFLWNDAALEARKASSPIWQSLEPRLGDLRQRYPDRPNLERQLLNAVLMIEEKADEAFSTVNFTHSAYYQHDAITTVVAKFLANTDWRAEIDRIECAISGRTFPPATLTPAAAKP